MAHIVHSGNVQARIAEIIKLHPAALFMKGSPSDAIEINLGRKPEQLWRTPASARRPISRTSHVDKQRSSRLASG